MSTETRACATRLPQQLLQPLQRASTHTGSHGQAGQDTCLCSMVGSMASSARPPLYDTDTPAPGCESYDGVDSNTWAGGRVETVATSHATWSFRTCLCFCGQSILS